MFIKLYVGLVLLCSDTILLVEGSPIVQGRNGDYSTLPSGETLSQDSETAIEDSEINKIVASAALPRFTMEALDENNGELFVANSFELNQNHTSPSEIQGILQAHQASQNQPKFQENSNAYDTDELSTIANSANGGKTLTNAEMTTQYQAFSNQSSQVENNQKSSNSDANYGQTAFVESLVTTPDSGSINLFTNSYYSDYGDLQNENMNEHDGSMNSDENDEDEDEESLPSALKNLPHDIPTDRTIYEVLAENIVKDKHYDEFRIDELIHELMDHYDAHNGLGEVYAGEADYEEKANPENKDSVPMLEWTIESSSTASPYK